ncbi:MAG: LamB/YcsF family protein [Gammaproteobacteria bacterium]|nr:LamB/YcsF family protein [Gammaproteobacteria bacterium]
MHWLDLNADLGEGYGPWTLGRDAELMPYLSSVNVACGLHAGDWRTMATTVRLAVDTGVAIGAHPGWPDRQGFGRREMAIAPDEAYELVLYQIGALAGFVHAAGGRLAHVKPHGALYNQAARDPALAEAVARAVFDFGPGLVLVGLAGSALIAAGRSLGLATRGEAFADRRYRADGSLKPRGEPGAVLHDEDEVLAQVLSLVQTGTVIADTGQPVAVAAQTLCLHGDTPEALAFARRLNAELRARGIAIGVPV